MVLLDKTRFEYTASRLSFALKIMCNERSNAIYERLVVSWAPTVFDTGYRPTDFVAKEGLLAVYGSSDDVSLTDGQKHINTETSAILPSAVVN